MPTVLSRPVNRAKPKENQPFSKNVVFNPIHTESTAAEVQCEKLQASALGSWHRVFEVKISRAGQHFPAQTCGPSTPVPCLATVRGRVAHASPATCG